MLEDVGMWICGVGERTEQVQLLFPPRSNWIWLNNRYCGAVFHSQ